MIQSMLGAMDELCTMLVPCMHCNMIFNFVINVTIVEVHKLILDVCESQITSIDYQCVRTDCLQFCNILGHTFVNFQGYGIGITKRK